MVIGRFVPAASILLLILCAGCGGGGSSSGSRTARTVTAVSVTPATVNVALGVTQQFSALATYSDGTTGEVTSSATWTSSATTVATISASGLASTKSQGSATITAQDGSVSGSANVTVGPAALKSIAVSGPSSVAIGGHAQFQATGTYTDGTQQDLSSSATWSIAPGFRAQVNSSGLLTPVSTGLASVTASSGAVSGAATAEVTATARYILASSQSPSDAVNVFAVDGSTLALRNRGYVPTGSGSFPSSVAVHPSQPWLYVADAGANSLSAYVVGAGGSLTPIPGSPYATGNDPGYVAVDPAGKYVFVANRGSSNTVSMFAVDSTTGALSPAATPSVAAASEPSAVTVDPSGRFVYIVNRLSNNILIYALDSAAGTLTAVGAAVATLPNPVVVVADPTGKFLFVGGTLVDTYTIAPATGALTPVAGNPFGPNGVDAFSLAVDPLGHFLYFGDIVAAQIHIMAINSSSGALTEVPGSPVGTGNNPLSMQVDPSGKSLYVLAGGESSVWQYSIDATTGTLTKQGRVSALMAGTSLAVLSGAAPVQSTPTYAYVAESGGSEVRGYAIDPQRGSLSQLATSPYPFGFAPQGIATDLFGRWVFTADFMGSKVSQTVIATGGALQNLQNFAMTDGAITSPEGAAVDASSRFLFVPANNGFVMDYLINQADGTLSPNPLMGFALAGTNPVAAAVEPGGKFVYTAAFGSNAIFGFNIDTHTGVLNAAYLSPYLAGVNPTAIAIDPSGQFLYAANFGSNTVSPYTINVNNGNLTAVGGGAVATGVQPDALAVSLSGKYLYVANLGSSTLSSYSIDGQTGALTPLAAVIVVNSPSALAMDISGRYLYVSSQNTNTVTAFAIDDSTGALTAVGGPVTTGAQPSGVVTTGLVN